ncbi:hypothetical protein ACWEP8_00615 [Streptomyces hydrogenans]
MSITACQPGLADRHGCANTGDFVVSPRETPATRERPGAWHKEPQLPTRIHRIPKHDGEFVIIASKAIQDRRLTHTARGVLALLLSLPDGVRTNVRTLADAYPQGRRAVEPAPGPEREPEPAPAPGRRPVPSPHGRPPVSSYDRQAVSPGL